MYRNLVNSLTVARLVLTPFVVAAILHHNNRLALGLVIAAGLSDGLDGFLARKLKAASRFGAYLDPIADKALLVSIYIAFGFAHVLPWWLIGIVLGRDVLILGMVGWGMLFTSIRIFPPSIWGKITTFTQIVAVVILLADARPYFSRKLLLASVAATTVWSALHYAARGIRLLRKERIDGTIKQG